MALAIAFFALLVIGLGFVTLRLEPFTETWTLVAMFVAVGVPLSFGAIEAVSMLLVLLIAKLLSYSKFISYIVIVPSLYSGYVLLRIVWEYFYASGACGNGAKGWIVFVLWTIQVLLAYGITTFTTIKSALDLNKERYSTDKQI
jgi:hypothetical protein